ncbi:hypothetical protein [Burkholderia sp. 3C]
MKLTRINVCTLVLAVVLAVFTTPVYKDLVAQIPGAVLSMSRWLLTAFVFAAAGASALYGARRLARWIFAHTKVEDIRRHHAAE